MFILVMVMVMIMVPWAVGRSTVKRVYLKMGAHCESRKGRL